MQAMVSGNGVQGSSRIHKFVWSVTGTVRSATHASTVFGQVCTPGGGDGGRHCLGWCMCEQNNRTTTVAGLLCHSSHVAPHLGQVMIVSVSQDG